MAVSRVKTWADGDVLTAAELNAEFNNIIQGGVSLISPLLSGESLDLDGKSLILDAGGSSSLSAGVANGQVDIALLGVNSIFKFDGTTSSSLNGITFTTGATTVAPAISVSGETNVDLNLVPRGTGTVQIAGSDIAKHSSLNHGLSWFSS